jgi:hypothetical protein
MIRELMTRRLITDPPIRPSIIAIERSIAIERPTTIESANESSL